MPIKISIGIRSFEVNRLLPTKTKHKNFAPSSGRSPLFLAKPRYARSSGSHGPSEPSSYVACGFIRIIALPKVKSNYTVLRSPHIDKKSRDQFELIIHKQLIIITTDIKKIRDKLFQLKFHEMQGVQMKIVFQSKTRLNYNYKLRTL